MRAVLRLSALHLEASQLIERETIIILSILSYIKINHQKGRVIRLW
jgi:hypothetical protein